VHYDFGPGHPLTPRRFGPGISLLEALGATRFEEPEPAGDEQLRLVHTSAYLDTVKSAGFDARFDRIAAQHAGLGPGDNPIFPGMHEAAAAVAGGSLAAMEHLLHGSETHAFHPGGGLHHAMADRASGFCIYNDPAIAIARARQEGLRVLYVDLDVHHGDGVQAAFWDDPAVMTISLHESGAYLFPGTGSIDELGGPEARGTKVNMPFEPGTSDGDWLAALERLVPPLAERHRPDILVSQHGADSHALDPLAHLMLSTRAMHRAARLLDGLAHQYCGGRWLATGGGGYDIHRVVPRSWAIVWSAQAHIEPEGLLPQPWRSRWAEDADRARQAPIPERLLDPENMVREDPGLSRVNGRALDAVELRVISPA
jgi:acetoin utilization protein AcuC